MYIADNVGEWWSNERKEGPLDKWSPTTTTISATIKFAIATGSVGRSETLGKKTVGWKRSINSKVGRI